jgi:hypothetical protein
MNSTDDDDLLAYFGLPDNFLDEKNLSSTNQHTEISFPSFTPKLLSIDAKNKEFKLLPEQKDAEELANINCVDNGAENVHVNIKKFTNFIDEPSPPTTNAVVASNIQQHIKLDDSMTQDSTDNQLQH